MQNKILDSVFVCLIYAFCSMAFSFSAKFLFKIFAFHNTTILLLYETTINIVICTLYKIIKYNKEKKEKKDSQMSISQLIVTQFKERMKQNKLTIPFSITYGTGAYCGMTALSKISIPLFLALRRTLIFFVFVVQILMGKQNQQISFKFIISVLFITSGAIIAGLDHFNDDIQGYVLLIINNMLSALSLHMAQNLNQSQQFSPFDLVYNNSINLWPVLLIISIVTKDIQSFFEFESLYRTEFMLSFSLVALFGFFLNLATYNCTMKNSPFAIALTHNIKDIFSTVLSILVFADIQPDTFLTFGISLSFVGSFIYSLTKMQEIKKKQQQTIELTNQEIKVLIKQ
ncbi:unnamed protein product (macronuclear) [Paramecium tetraurelia]|uniref:Sugar phosphate transporter domain-containing protein n=1 Tax=Paramecium tetraurelia TaxID=5888 RepID=A0BJA2_PARTE|nr:uncharacterized protein GSPATT00004992001 [Paramecium tetraurelia]CAK58619.1 unnamed protein product [Paramecium tetraurelia]|eukprot:XP_001426017.1 hypothetical protein (macronuclear) [Paramecium tetraurelia strain d4-2]